MNTSRFQYLAPLLVFMLSGCMSVSSGPETPSEWMSDYGPISRIYVERLAADQRGVDVMIADWLIARGYDVATGSAASDDADAMITYRDRWTWDMTMYMRSLSVRVRDPKSGRSVAEASSLRSSLSRRSPEEMVDEVLSQIFPAGGSQ